MPKKKFIDKKNAVSFHLVHRSQQDPLAADETAPQRVLLPVNSSTQPKSKQVIEEEHKFGIFFDDEYNYLQHLKEGNHIVEWVPTESTQKDDKGDSKKTEKDTKLNLPSSVFASTVEEDVGMLNKAASSGLRLDLDPDIIAALDEDFDFDDSNNALEDDFMELANAECSGDELDEYYDEDDDELDGRSNVSSNFEDEEMDEVGSLPSGQFTFKDEETKSRFTDYSMSSSDIKRNDQLTLLDERFEQMFSKYDDTEIGPLDCDEITGYVPENSDILLQYATEFKKDQQREMLDKELITKRVQLQDEDSDDSGDEDLVKREVKPKEKWDCESILSTYSNLYNHPKVISEPKSNRIKLDRHGIPVVESNRLTAKALKNLDESTAKSGGSKSVGAQSVLSTLSTLSIRPKGELPAERNVRKKELKEYRRERRIERKVNTEAFKEEAKRQVKINLNNRMNIQGNRIL